MKFLTFVFLIVQNGFLSTVDAIDAPICIVGAGISGLSLGNILQSKGNSVLLLEKNAIVGGKIATFRYSDLIKVEKCPVVFSPFNEYIMKYVRQFRLTPVPFNNSDSATFNPLTGGIQTPAPLTNLQMSVIQNAAQRYVEYHAEYVANGVLDFGYITARSHPDIFVPTGQWLDERDLMSLKPFFRLILTTEGYGDIDDTPALYSLKLMDRTLLVNVTMNPKGGFFTLLEGYDILVHRMATPLRVKLNHDVVKIDPCDPSGNATCLLVHTIHFGLPEIIRCSKVILAFPPVLKNVEKILRNLTQEEKDILGQVKVNKYTSQAHHIPVLDKTVYAHVGTLNLISPPPGSPLAMGDGGVILIARQSLRRLQHVYSSYSFIRGDFTELPTPSDMELIDQKLNATLREIAGNATVTTIFAPTQKNEYFPHVNTTSLQNGFYEQFDRLQGRGGIYYATTLLGFEGMDLAIQMTEGFVKRYFA